MKRALILKGGTMRGAYTVGALKTFHRMLGVNHFDAIFATSVGVFEQAFFASEQIFFMENTWKEYVTDRKLINFWNPLMGKPILDLDYLVGLFQSEKSMLDLEKMKAAQPKLFTFMAEYESREPIMVDLKNSPVFDVMRATCCLPIIYPKPVIIEGKRYIDCWLAPREKFTKAIEEVLKDYDEIIAIGTFPKDPVLDAIKTIKIKKLHPAKLPLRHTIDTNKNRLIKTIEQGEKEAEKFIIENNLPKR